MVKVKVRMPVSKYCANCTNIFFIHFEGIKVELMAD